LVNDLFARLECPLGVIGLDLVRRTGDHPTRLSDHPHVLLTTPESFDSLLCRGLFRPRSGHALAQVTAVVLDEIHLLHGSPRGEMLTWLLERLRLLRGHARRESWVRQDKLQVVALSATLSNPASVVREYLPGGTVVHVAGSRQIEVVSEGEPIEDCLPAYLHQIERPEKILVFCNSRKRADTLARDLAGKLQARKYTFAVHHGSLAKDLREDTEEKFHREKRIVVFATSTLELGIDIGDIDLVVLDGAPPDVNSLLQRIGRGNRRRKETRVMMCSPSLKDRLFQAALRSLQEITFTFLMIYPILWPSCNSWPAAWRTSFC
jgi:ATP-dependent Lhr-like helicase